MQELFSSPPLSPQPNRRISLGSAASSSKDGGSMSPCPPFFSRSILEMDQERRARREEARKEQGAKSELLWNEIHVNQNHLVQAKEDDMDSIGSLEGVTDSTSDVPCSANNTNQSSIDRGAFSHKRRRLCHYRTMDNPNGSTETVLTLSLPGPKTTYSPPVFSECGYFCPDALTNHYRHSMLMSLLTEGMATPASMAVFDTVANESERLSTTTSTMMMTIVSHFLHHPHKRKQAPDLHNHSYNNNKSVIRASPLHLYHAQQRLQTAAAASSCSAEPSPTRSCSVSNSNSPQSHLHSILDPLVCHLKPRRSVGLEENFNLQLSLKTMTQHCWSSRV
jgi:hypothetical protein